ncbi:uncharacterized protein PAC_13487 [Phialocephala subalpina]|uniref:Proteophosphoglycan ppg4 n=1 Tax=Phialocephala subalpina TaxID=576137 RepID=A0A1L7XEX0_9HELO|nr:uncharacterized protein PAC_13487 [Phialocephala subalpina]
MGNEQSAPTPRRRPPNKLSKPRTNNHSNANLLDRRASAPVSRRNSISTNGSPTKIRGSAIPVDALVETIEGRKEEKSRRRMSLFRSKSAKPHSRKPEEDTDGDTSTVEPDPFVQSSHRWSREPRVRGNSFTTQSSVEPPGEFEQPSHRWSAHPRVRAYSVTTSSSLTSSIRSERVYPEQPTPATQAGLTKPPMRSRMSLQTYAHHPRLSLVAELPSPQPDNTNGIKRLSRYGQEDGSPGGLTEASRTNSESALYAPIRRRSLLQHGVATRTSFVESDHRSSLPSQASPDNTPPRKPVPPPQEDLSDDMRDYYYNPSKPTSSPLSDLVLLGPNPAFADIGPRTETPTQLEHIGTFKLGTLRITNGAASPVSSFRSAEEDYVAAGNTRRSQDSTHENGHNHRSKTLSIPAETRKMPWIVRAESPLRQAQELEHKSLTIETQIPFIDPSFKWIDFEGTEQLLKSTESPTKALELARDYQQDLALSPFSFDNSPLPSPRLESTSKHTAIEDDLFEAEPATPNITPNLSARAPRSFDSAYDNGFAPPVRVVKGPREHPPKPLAKADSGYSSNISLRSFKRDSVQADVQAEELPPTAPKGPPSRVASSTYSVASADSDLTLRMKRSLPSLPPQEPPPPPPMREAPPVPPPHSPTYDLMKEYPNPPAPEKDIRASKSQPLLSVPSKHTHQKSMPNTAPARNVREESPANSELSTTSSNSSRWSSKSKISKRPVPLQPAKRDPSPKPQPRTPEPVYTVQAFRSPSEQLRIPAPSIEARRHLDERVETFPVQTFPNTYSGHAGLRHSSSKETLGTIFSVGSAEVRDELNFARLQGALPPVPVQPSIPEYPVKTPVRKEIPTPKPEFNRRNTFQVAPPVPAQDMGKKESRWGRRSLHSSTTMGRDRSLPRLPASQPAVKPISNEKLEDHLTSYDTISSSLGKSPYELAAAIPKPKQTSVNERAKSITAQFEADAAARFNLARANSQIAHQEPGPHLVTRVRSYDSIANGNPFSSNNNSRRSSREHHPPPQVQRNNSPWRPAPVSVPTSYSTQSLPLQLPNSQSPLTAHPPQFHRSFPNVEREEKRLSNASTGSARTKAQPPVSMTTQRNSKLVQSSQPIGPPPAQAPPPPPTRAENKNQSQENGWSNTASAWAARRQSAGEALQSRKSIEMRRPTPQELRSRKSMDGSRMNRPTSEQRELKGRGSYDQMRWEQGAQHEAKMQTKGWNVGVGYEDAHAYPSPPRQLQQSWSMGANANPNQQSQEYDHTYGSSLRYSHSYDDKENFHHQAQEYYEMEQQEDAQLGEQIHQRKTSTSEMLVLDRFSGGLDYGYEPGLGLVGSAGTRSVGKMANANRKSVVAAERWGVDLSDVPVFLQRVRVEG